MSRGRWLTFVARVSVTLALSGAGFLLAAPAQASAASFTWSGGDGSSSGWSLADNWAGSAPSAGDLSDGLDFPADLTGGDCASTQDDACYVSQDDIAGYAVNGITLEDGGSDDYLLESDSDNDTLELGAGGILASTDSSAAGGAEIEFPIELTSGEDWNIDGGPAGQGQLLLDQGLSAQSTSADSLAVYLEDYGVLTLSGDNEVGPVNLDTHNGDFLGYSQGTENGWVALDNAELNSADGQPVTVDDTGLLGDGTVGPLSANTGVISPGTPAGTLAVDGSVGLSSQSAFEPVIGGAPGTDSSELTATGNVDLGSAQSDDAGLDIVPSDPAGACPTLAFGASYTLISTTGSISGTFADADASGDKVQMDCTGSVVPVLTINYNTSSSPETVTATVSGPLLPTTTSVTSNETAVEDQPEAAVALSATVSSPGGSPQGSVEFEQSVSPLTPPATGSARFSSPPPQPNWTPIPGCSAVPVGQAGGSDTASCDFTNPPSGTYLSIEANFVPAASSQFAPSTGGGFGIPMEGPNAPSNQSQGLGLTTSVKGNRLSVTMACPTGTGCFAKLRLQASETLRHGKVVAVAAAKRTVTVGNASEVLEGGSTLYDTLELNALGRKLLARFHHLTARLRVSSNGVSVLSANLTFREPAAHAPLARSAHAPIGRGAHAPPGY